MNGFLMFSLGYASGMIICSAMMYVTFNIILDNNKSYHKKISDLHKEIEFLKKYKIPSKYKDNIFENNYLDDILEKCKVDKENNVIYEKSSDKKSDKNE